MIHRTKLLADLQRLLKKLEDDLRRRSEDVGEVATMLKAQYEQAKDAKRTAAAYTVWRDEIVTQVGVAWILGCVFVRFLEDNELLDHPFLSGPGPRLQLARDQHTLYFRQYPTQSDRDYLEHVFRTVAKLPALDALFSPKHNLIWLFGPTGDAAGELLRFWQQIEPSTGALDHDFTDPNWDTRFLGDLYQDLSEAARKKYALLQTPEFVEEFILDRTLTTAIHTFGLGVVRMIDPTCGSAHFLLGGFHRLLELWQHQEPATNIRELVQRTLNALYGVDLNPFAVAIARFRLLIAALRACDIQKLKHAPDFKMHLAAGDSLLHGRRPRHEVEARRQAWFEGDEVLKDSLKHFYDVEDREELTVILGQQYHAVVGNPPYITVKDKALNQAYRERFGSCHMKYSLAVPFAERFFDLAIQGNPAMKWDPFAKQRETTQTPRIETRMPEPAGYVGMITSNSFMKREFGKELIEEFIPRWDLTHVIDTAGAYIPGHGTPTVILFGRHQPPVAPTIRTVMGIKGEPATPEDPAHGLVWTAIVAQVDQPGSESLFVSVADTARESFHKHPWSIGGGGAAELKEMLDEAGEKTLGNIADQIGIGAVTGEDDLYLMPNYATARRLGIELTRPLVLGDQVRDWCLGDIPVSIWLYDNEFNLLPFEPMPCTFRLLWPAKALISRRKRFGTPMIERGLTWYEWQELYVEKLKTLLTITFGEVATHNHFVLDRGGKVFKQTAPVIKLPTGATEADHFALLGLLNSSTGCFWLKQVCFPKGGDHQGGEGARVRSTLWDERYAFNSTQVDSFPIPSEKPLVLAQEIDRLAQKLNILAPAAMLSDVCNCTRAVLDTALQRRTETINQMMALQEELDWECYRHYGLLGERSSDPLSIKELSAGETPALPGIKLGERAFEIVMARKMAAGELQTTWFERHGSTPITKLPAHWPPEYRALVERRIKKITEDRNISLIEQPEYKRRWNFEPWAEQLTRALREWLLNRLEALFGGPAAGSPQAEPARGGTPTVELTTAHRLADQIRSDADFLRVAELYRGRPDFDLPGLVTELVEGESVPFLPFQRYKESGLRKRAVWEQVWDLQRKEDAIDAEVRRQRAEDRSQDEGQGAETAMKEEIQRRQKQEVGDIPVPPKYASADFKDSTYWRLRGKLDVPKERFISYPGCERGADDSLVIAWAGWDHLQQAKALSDYYEQLRQEGAGEIRLLLVLAGLQQLVPWLLQWHNELDPEFGLRLGDFYRDHVREEARRLGKTDEEVRKVGYGQ